MTPPRARQSATATTLVGRSLAFFAGLAALLFACRSAFTIRMFAIDGYGRLIHECVTRAIGARGSRRGWRAREDAPLNRV
jgi:hypothetical protein